MPEDAPASLKMLSLQCVTYDFSLRPISQEVLDWLQDLHTDFEEDEISTPPMKEIPGVTDFEAVPIPTRTRVGSVESVTAERRISRQTSTYQLTVNGIRESYNHGGHSKATIQHIPFGNAGG